jgi:hypothetical protein
MDRKRLVSSAPATSILNAQAFRYTSSVATDIRKTFERLRRAEAKQRQVATAHNVHTLTRKPVDGPARRLEASA